jgi:predicted transcriptional regulator
MMIKNDDDRLSLIEAMIASGDVYEGYREKGSTYVPKPKLVQKVRKKRETYEHITDEMIFKAFSHDKTWEEIGASLGMTMCSVRKRAIALGLDKDNCSGKHAQIKLPTYDLLKKLAIPERTWKEIAKMLGVSRFSLVKYAKSVGITKKRTPQPYHKKIDPQRMKDLVDQNLSWQKIADTLGISCTYAYMFAKKLGLYKGKA